ncbi:MAG: RNA polymerase sigma factor [Acidimicrobiia bacterium]
MSIRSDHDLVAAAVGGDREALDQLLRRHHARIAAVCRRMTGNAADGADATQEALIAIVRGLHKFDGRSSFGTWAYRVAVNASLDELRRRRRRPTDSLDDVDRHRPEPSIRSPEDPVVDRLALGEAAAALPEEYRVAVILRDIGDLDYSEIAEVLGVAIGTVKSRIARGRSILARQLGNHDDDPERPTTGRDG